MNRKINTFKCLVNGDVSFSSDPKLCCGSKEDAYYIGTHFIDLYRDYLLPEF